MSSEHQPEGMSRERFAELYKAIGTVIVNHNAKTFEVVSVCTKVIGNAIVMGTESKAHARKMCKVVFNFLMQTVEQRGKS